MTPHHGYCSKCHQPAMAVVSHLTLKDVNLTRCCLVPFEGSTEAARRSPQGNPPPAPKARQARRENEILVLGDKMREIPLVREPERKPRNFTREAAQAMMTLTQRQIEEALPKYFDGYVSLVELMQLLVTHAAAGETIMAETGLLPRRKE